MLEGQDKYVVDEGLVSGEGCDDLVMLGTVPVIEISEHGIKCSEKASGRGAVQSEGPEGDEDMVDVAFHVVVGVAAALKWAGKACNGEEGMTALEGLERAEAYMGFRRMAMPRAVTPDGWPPCQIRPRLSR